MQELRDLPDMPPGLREAAQREALVPFVGAGASRIAGCPGWGDFASIMTPNNCIPCNVRDDVALAHGAIVEPK